MLKRCSASGLLKKLLKQLLKKLLALSGWPSDEQLYNYVGRLAELFCLLTAPRAPVVHMAGVHSF